MRYREITVRVAGEHADEAGALLRKLTVSGVAIERPFAQPDLDCDAETVGDATAVVRAWVAADDGYDLAEVQAALREAGFDASINPDAADETDWAEAWKRHFGVERYGERLVVVPSWLSHEAREGDLVIRLDPGMAFGTGQHETTRMCLEALERCVRNGDRVLDVGCGSGILSLAAARLGARGVVALDIDETAVRVARENVAANEGGGAVRVARGSLGTAWPDAAGAASGFDVVVSNIVAAVIVELAPDLVSALTRDGRLIASGIIGEREDAVRDALVRAGGAVRAVHATGDWRCIEAVRP